jgi:integrase
MRRELLPLWQNRQLSAITRQDVIDVVKAVNARGTPYAAHHVLAYIKAFFSHATANNLLEHSPADRIKPKDLIGKREPRQRVLSDDELRAVWRAAERCADFGKLAQLIMVTGTRRGEAAGARSEEFDDKLWTIPAELFKTNTTHLVPLSPLALDIAKSVPFGVTGFSKSKKRLDRYVLAELRKINPRATLTNWTLHDLRRTVRTRLSALTTYEVAELIIGHGKKGLQKVYDQHEYLDEMREALDAWAARLTSIVSDTRAKSFHNHPLSEHMEGTCNDTPTSTTHEDSSCSPRLASRPTRGTNSTPAGRSPSSSSASSATTRLRGSNGKTSSPSPSAAIPHAGSDEP